MGEQVFMARDAEPDTETGAESDRGVRPATATGDRPLARPSSHGVQLGLQAKLAVGRVDDPLERDADRIADALMRASPSPAAGAGPTRIRRSRSGGDRLGDRPVDADLERSISARLGRGAPLSADVAQRAGDHLGHDLSGVRVHTDGPADRLARSLDARAFTVGRDVFARADERAAVRGGLTHLLAHELAHVAQQNPAGRIRRAPGPTIRRNPESAALLKRLATPVARAGPSVTAQKEVVDALLEQRLPSGSKILCLGGIALSEITGDDEELIRQATDRGLIDLRENSNQQVGKYPGGYVGQSATQQVKDAGVERQLIQNTLRTMIDAEQVAYLRAAGLPNDEWVILVEIHFYLDRDMTMWGFHKDTKGQTLFVNLNFHLDQDVVGPEYVVNPPPSPEHDRAIGIDPDAGTATATGTLPQEFLADLLAARALDEPSEIGTRTVPAYGYVGFVDEAIHHATPLYGHRSVQSSQFARYLADAHPAEFAAAKQAYDRWKRRWLWYGYESYLASDSPISQDLAPKWLGWMQMADSSQGETDHTRRDFRDSGMDDGEIDRMLERVGELFRGDGTKRPQNGNKVSFYLDASIPSVYANVKQGPDATTTEASRSPLKTGGRPPLKRQMSQNALDDTLPAPIPEGSQRRFFRTWVRAVRRPRVQ